MGEGFSTFFLSAFLGVFCTLSGLASLAFVRALFFELLCELLFLGAMQTIPQLALDSVELALKDSGLLTSYQGGKV